MLRAIYTRDVMYTVCPIFELNAATGNFEEVIDKELFVPFDAVMNDPSWIVFAVSGDSVTLLDTPRRLSDDEISTRLQINREERQAAELSDITHE